MSRSPNRCIHLLKAPSLESSNPAAFSARTYVRLPRRHSFGPRLSGPADLACERKTSRVSQPPVKGALFEESKNPDCDDLLIVGSSIPFIVYYVLICSPISRY
jgi:hypothetical protein